MKKILTTLTVVISSVVICVGAVYAATTHNVTSRLGGVSGDAFDLDGTLIVDSLKVGAQGVGGVTFFNGTIVNNTTGTGGADNPVTFGDNVRIDGTVYRGATAGTSDTMPFKINDNLEVAGSLTIGSLLGTGMITTSHLLDGTVVTGDLADEAVTSPKIAAGAVTQTVENSISDATNISGVAFVTLTSVTMTTGDSSLLCFWSGWGDTQNASEVIRVQMLLDNTLVPGTYRISSSVAAGVHRANMATQAIIPVSAGSHTISIQCNTTTSANMYHNNLDCIELKK